MNIRNISSIPLIAIIIIGIAVLLPLPGIVVDVLLMINLLHAIFVFLIGLYTRKTKSFSLLPIVLIFSTIFSLAVNISSIRLILNQGTSIDVWLIRNISNLVAGSGEILILSVVIFITLLFVQALVIVRGCASISKQVLSAKENNQKEKDFYGAMEGAVKLLSHSEKLRIAIILIPVIGGIVVGTMIHDETIINSLKTYIPPIIGNGLLLMLPAFLLYLTASNEVRCKKMKRNIKGSVAP